MIGMEICHKLTEIESNELYNIIKLLRCEDKESIQLGWGLLENYPSKMYGKYIVQGTIHRTCTIDYVKFLAYANSVDKVFFKDVSGIIEVLMNILLEDCYYYEADD